MQYPILCSVYIYIICRYSMSDVLVLSLAWLAHVLKALTIGGSRWWLRSAMDVRKNRCWRSDQMDQLMHYEGADNGTFVRFCSLSRDAFIGKPSDFPPEVLLLLGVLLRGSGWGKSKDGSQILTINNQFELSWFFFFKKPLWDVVTCRKVLSGEF